MRYLFDFLRKQYFYFLFLLLEIISLVLLFNYNAYQNSAFAHSSANLAGSVLDISSRISDYFSKEHFRSLCSHFINFYITPGISDNRKNRCQF